MTCRYMARVHFNISNFLYGQLAYTDRLKLETGIGCRYIISLSNIRYSSFSHKQFEMHEFIISSTRYAF